MRPNRLCGMAVALDHLKRDEKKDNAACDLKGANGHADLLEHEVARKKKELQRNKRDQHGIERQPALRGRVAARRHNQK